MTWCSLTSRSDRPLASNARSRTRTASSHSSLPSRASPRPTSPSTSSLQPSSVSSSSHHRSICALYSADDFAISARRVYDLHSARTSFWRCGETLVARGRWILGCLAFFVAVGSGAGMLAWRSVGGTRGSTSVSWPTLSSNACSYRRQSSPFFPPDGERSSFRTPFQSSLANCSSSCEKDLSKFFSIRRSLRHCFESGS
jgi:hypothetical protein